MRKLIVTTLSALGVGLLIATPDQAKADFTWNCTSTSSGLQSASSGLQSASSGLQSVSFTGNITTQTSINGVQQPPTTQEIRESYTNVFPSTTSNCVDSNPGNGLLPNLDIGNGINSNPGSSFLPNLNIGNGIKSNPGSGFLPNLNIGNGINLNPGNGLLPNLNIGNGINLNSVIFQNQKRR